MKGVVDICWYGTKKYTMSVESAVSSECSPTVKEREQVVFVVGPNWSSFSLLSERSAQNTEDVDS